MGRSCATKAVARFGHSGHFRLLTRFERPSPGSLQARQNMPAAIASARQKFGRLLGHDPKAQRGIGHRAVWKARLAPAANALRDFPKAGPLDPRKGRIQS